MAGSIYRFNYESDMGPTYFINQDRSNAEATDPGGIRVSEPFDSRAVDELPKIIKPRILHLQYCSNPKLKRHIICGNRNLLRELFSVRGVTDFLIMPLYPGQPADYWDVTGYTGERGTPVLRYGSGDRFGRLRPDTGLTN